MEANIIKKDYFKKILDHLIEHAPDGVYAGELRKKYGERYKDVVHYLDSRQAVHLDYSVMRDQNIDHSLMYLIIPDSDKLIRIKNETFWVRFVKEFATPSTLIAFISLIISMILLLRTV